MDFNLKKILTQLIHVSVENRGLDECLDVIIQPILIEYELSTILQKRALRTTCLLIT